MQTQLYERKQQYLEAHPNRAKRSEVQNTFKRLVPLEEELGLDFCDIRNMETIHYLIAAISTKQLRRIEMTLRCLQEYCDWCVANRYTDCNFIAGITGESINITYTVGRDMFPDASALQAYLVIQRPAVSLDDIATMYHAYYWMVFMGLLPEQACSLLKTDVNLQNRTVRHDGNIIEILKEAKQALACAVQLDKIRSGGSNGVVSVYRSDKLFVNARKEMCPRDFWYLDRRYRDRYQNRLLDWEDVYLSGVFSRMYHDRECAGLPYNFAWLFEQKAQNREYQHPKIYYKNQKVRELEYLYRQWKQAFALS